MNKKYYFINNFDTNIIDKQDQQTIIIYRNYSSKKPDDDLVLKIKQYCKKRGVKFYLSNNVKLAIRYNLDGVYIPAFNNGFQHLSHSIKKNFKIVGSAHNLKEINIKTTQNVEQIFISSLFKKNKNYLGINKFKLITNLTKKEVIVLGGISNKNLNRLKLINCVGFAGISYFE